MKYLEKIEDQRNNFIKFNDIPSSVRPDILNSWIRCKNYGVDVNMKKVKLLSKSEFDNVLSLKKSLYKLHCL
jgi:hypothetical protein